MSNLSHRRPLLLESDNSEAENVLDDQPNPINSINNEVIDATEVQVLRRGHANHHQEPVDKYNFTYMAFYLLGMATLLPWNFFITAEEYWQFKFRNITANGTDELNSRQIQFQSDLSVASAVPNTVFLILNAILSQKFPLKVRMIGSLIVMYATFVMTTVFVKIDTDSWQDEFFIITLTSVVVVNAFSAILSGGLFGIAGQFSSDYMTAVVSGQALGGIFTAVADIIILTFGASPITSGFFYFLVGAFLLLVSLICYIVMSKTLYFQFFVEKRNLSDTSDLIEECDISEESNPQFINILSKIWVYGFSEWLVFVTTLSVYPSVTALVGSQGRGHGRWNDVYFVPVTNYLIFNSGDYLGRILAGLTEWPSERPYLIGFLTILRMAFIPAFLVCNIVPPHDFPIYIHSDLIFIVMMGVFAITNGYIANIALIGAPRYCDDHEKEMASSIMAAFLGIGLACGSSLSFMIVETIK